MYIIPAAAEEQVMALAALTFPKSGKCFRKFLWNNFPGIIKYFAALK
jgi:hypothetical protein